MMTNPRQDWGSQRKPNRSFRFLIVFLSLSASLSGGPVNNYKPYTAAGTSRQDGRSVIILRAFQSGRNLSYLVVDPETLLTSIRTARDLRVVEKSWDMILRQYEKTPYMKALRDAESNAVVLQNAGLTHFNPSPKGVTLTIDLCPSQSPMDRNLFSELIREFGKEEKPVPVAVAVTGIWMARHGADLEWLRGLEREGKMAITWINHSYHHRWEKGRPLKQNFLLARGTEIEPEILQTEIAMIERGLEPSVFFRFPGLVSDRRLVLLVGTYGLIPVGSDAWLGKNQWPKEGSIVLLHGNGNEPIGIRRFLQLIRDERDAIIHKQWLLYDLRESTILEEKKKSPNL
jgi:hypothetical protein